MPPFYHVGCFLISSILEAWALASTSSFSSRCPLMVLDLYEESSHIMSFAFYSIGVLQRTDVQSHVTL